MNTTPINLTEVKRQALDFLMTHAHLIPPGRPFYYCVTLLENHPSNPRFALAVYAEATSGEIELLRPLPRIDWFYRNQLWIEHAPYGDPGPNGQSVIFSMDILPEYAITAALEKTPKLVLNN